MPDFSRKADQSLQDVLTRSGGKNPYGEPRFRLVWGWSRLTQIGGEWLDYDEQGSYLRTVAEIRWFPKYHPLNDYWYIEKWCPAVMYGSPAKWDAMTYETADGRRMPALGPYPERGDYECSWRVSLTKCRVHADRSNCLPKCINTEYFHALEPTATILEEYVSRVLRSELASGYERLKAIEREEERERQDRDRVRTDILTDDNDLYTGSYVAVPKQYDRVLQAWVKERTLKGQVN